MSDPLVDYLRSCCVHVLGEKPGCGFFVSPQLIVTCSHVVGRMAENGASIELKKWGRGGLDQLDGAALLRNYPADDIAFILTREPSPTYAPLSGEGARLGDRLTAFGFPRENGQYFFDQFSAHYEGQTKSLDSQGQVISQVKFKAGQVEGGYSGGPLLNLSTCRVMGVVVLTRDVSDDLGGWAIEIPVLERLLRESGQELSNVAPSWTDAEAKQREDSSAGMIQLTPEQLRELLKHPDQSEEIEQLSISLGENLNAMRLAIRSLGEIESQIPDEMLAQRLTESAKSFERQLGDLAILRSDDNEVEDRYNQAKLALESGNPEGADTSLGEAAELAKARARSVENLEAKVREVRESRLKEAAQATAQRGQLAMARFDYLAAAQYFAEAAELSPASMAHRSLEYRDQQASALYRYGKEKGDNVILGQAIEAYIFLLQSCSRDLLPLAWASIQNSLGTVFLALGEREENTKRLEEGLMAFRAALDETRRERVPLLWAIIQSNIGNMLRVLGQRTGSTEQLEEAVTALRLSLEECTRERVPLDWATTQNNLGTALATLGGLKSDTMRLDQAVSAFKAALAVTSRERVPLLWATFQTNLGAALFSLGQPESGTERLVEAVTAFKAALEETMSERVPLQWATIQNNLGTAFWEIGEREEGTDSLEEAVKAYRAALEVRTRELVPLEWAMTQTNLGAALVTLGQRAGGTEQLEKAVTAHRAALEVRTRELVPLEWAMTQNNLGNALASLGRRESGTERLEEAVMAYRAALEELRPERMPRQWEMCQNNLNITLDLLRQWEGGTSN